MIENTIFENLVHNEQYTRKVLPFLKENYFQHRTDKVLYKLIDEYVDKYNTVPTKLALEVEVGSYVGLS